MPDPDLTEPPLPASVDALTVACPTCRAVVGATCTNAGHYNYGKARGKAHLARRRAAGEVIRGRMGESSPSQVAARERNWSLFQIAGARSGLGVVRSMQRLDNEDRADVQLAIEALDRIAKRHTRDDPS